MLKIKQALFALGLALLTVGACAQDVDKIRKNLGERLPLLGKIDEIGKTPMPGLFEVRVGTDLFYTDANGNFLISGHLIDARTQKNLTEERQEKLLAIPFDQLPLKDAFTIVRGDGRRKIAIFEDPNCPYCKQFERDLQKVDNVTIYMLLYPILGDDSVAKSHGIWCSKDKSAAWLDQMLRGKAPAKPAAGCDFSPVTRLVEYGRQFKISGTPTLFLADGTRVPGAIPPAEVEKLLAQQK
jgi:thiol:disulfide interchange protein DsbC